MSDEAALDTPINRATIDQLPVETLDRWLGTVRERRLTLTRQIQAAKAERTAKRKDEVFDKYSRLYKRTEAQLEKLNEQIEKIDNSLNKLRALSLELEDADVVEGEV